MALPDDYKNMTLEELENYIEGFLSAKYGEEVRDNFARIAYILGQHVESTGADATSAEAAKNTAVTKAQEAAGSAEDAQEAAQQAAYSQSLSQTYLAQISARADWAFSHLTRSEYDALEEINPKGLYLVEEEHPNNFLTAYYPLRDSLMDQLHPDQEISVVGCRGLGTWDDTGKSFRTDYPAETAGTNIPFSSLFSAGTKSIGTRTFTLTADGFSWEGSGSGSFNTSDYWPIDDNPFKDGNEYTFTFQLQDGESLSKIWITRTGVASSVTLTAGENNCYSCTLAYADWSSLIGITPQVYSSSGLHAQVTIQATGNLVDTFHTNYLVIPSNQFSQADYSTGVTFAIDLKPTALADWTRIFQFYKPGTTATEGDLYATQGVTITGFWNGITAQQMGYGNYQCVTPNVWHTFVFACDRSAMRVYVDGSLKTTASNSAVMTPLLNHLGEFTQNWIGNSRFSDADYGGLLKNFRIYNSALTTEQISKINTRPTTSLYWGSCLLATSEDTQ